MLRPSRPALLPHHRFRAGTAQTLQAAQGQARGRGQAGLWSCAEVTSEDLQKLEARIAQIENGQVSGQIQNEEVAGLEARLALVETTENEKASASEERMNALSARILDLEFVQHATMGHIPSKSNKPGVAPGKKAVPLVWNMPGGEDGASNPDATGHGNPDATGDDKLHTTSEQKYSLRCSRAGPTSKPRHSGYGDLRV
jgi:hypothetical protein